MEDKKVIFVAVTCFMLTSFIFLLYYTPPTEETKRFVRIAFFGDQGLNYGGQEVLKLVKAEGAELVVHLGDLDYIDDPQFYDRINKELLDDITVISVQGNHDLIKWDEYEQIFTRNIEQNDELECVGLIGIKSVCYYYGIKILLINPEYRDLNNGNFVKDESIKNDYTWLVCAWHKNSNTTMTGYKLRQVEPIVYDSCKNGLVFNGHSHTYSRMKTMASIENLTVFDHSLDKIILTNNTNTVIVSGLGGMSERAQERCFEDCDEWASIYTENQNAKPSAIFCDFSLTTDKSICYLKNIDREIIDVFQVIKKH